MGKGYIVVMTDHSNELWTNTIFNSELKAFEYIVEGLQKHYHITDGSELLKRLQDGKLKVKELNLGEVGWNPENIEWRNIHGRIKKLKDMDDKHIVNLIHWLNHYCKGSVLITVLEKIAEKRKISKNFINNAPYSYINPFGDIEIWDYDINRTILVKEKRQ